jgi:beta-RFAP synthase
MKSLTVSSDMPQRVTVTTGARLHFGILSHAAQGQRQFGGIGLMVDPPGFHLQAEACPDLETGDVYAGPEEWSARVLEAVRRCREVVAGAPAACRWTLSETIRPHVGLGSGTQLALAVARAYTALRGESDCETTELARRAGRGLRSALGIHGFQHGGLIVEVGKRTTDQISPAISRIEWPDWTLLLVCPGGITGLSGAAEVQAFSQLPPMAKALSARLCQITLLELLPAILEQDFAVASESLFQFSKLVGEYFSPTQGGTYSTPQIRNLVKHLREQGIPGVGQSSWGPTAFVMCSSRAQAEQLQQDLRQRGWEDCLFLITTARNSGASVESFA